MKHLFSRREESASIWLRGWDRTRSAAVLFCLWGTVGCATMGLRSAVNMSVTVGEQAPPSALVYIDGQYIGTLEAVAARGVRIPEGKHRLTVEKTGFFPYDTIIVSDLHPIHLKIDLLPLPD